MAQMAPLRAMLAELHHSMAMPLLTGTRDLAAAYRYLKEADALHQSVTGLPSADAAFQMACCLSNAADAQLRSGDVDVAPGLPPTGQQFNGSALGQARVALAMELLAEAVTLGFHDVPRLMAEPRLRLVRDVQAGRLAALLERLATPLAVVAPAAVITAGFASRPAAVLVPPCSALMITPRMLVRAF